MIILKCAYNLLTNIIAPLIFIKKAIIKSNPPYGSRVKELAGNIPKKDYHNPIWFHTVSVGETQGAIPLIKKFHNLYPDISIVVTTTTTTSAELYKKLDYVTHLYGTFDASFMVKKFTERLKPRALIIMETELWPNLLDNLSKQHVPVILMNARLSDKSASRYRKLGRAFDELISGKIVRFICQTEADKSNFASLGVTGDKLTVSGSLKYDIEIPENIHKTGFFASIPDERPVLCVASTHDGEDEKVLSIFGKIKKKIPEILMIIVPRHPERFISVFNLAQKAGYKTANKTDGAIEKTTEIVIGNTMGEMTLYMGVSTIVLMAGSLTDIGGHNPLEAIAVNKPVITGASIRNFKKIYQELEKADATVVATEDNLADTIIDLLLSHEKRESMNHHAQKVLLNNRGAIDRTIAAITESLDIK